MIDPLLVPIVIPVVAGAVCLILPRRWQLLRGPLSVIATAATLTSACPLLGQSRRWDIFGTVLLRADELSGFILLATAAFALLIAVYSAEFMKGKPGGRLYNVCCLWTLALSCGVLLANDLLLLLIGWGLLALTLYLMIGISGPDAGRAARKTFVMVGGSDALLLLGIAVFWVRQGSTRMDGPPLYLDSATDYVALTCFVAAAFAKAGAVPLHSWLPDCGEKALAPVTAFLPASLDKLLGIYLLVRISNDLFVITGAARTALMIFGALTIIGAVLMALVQHDLKRLLAYHAVSQVGYMVMGIGTGTVLGLAGALFHMLNHAIYKSCLFLGAGVVEDRAGSVDLDRLGGLAGRLPLTFACCLVAALAISGIPPLNGFASKWMIYQAVIEAGLASGHGLWILWLTAAMLGSVLTLASFVKVLHSVFLCKPSPPIRQRVIQRPGLSMTLPMVVLAGLCVLLGVFAQAVPLRYLIQPALSEPIEYFGSWLAGRVAGLLVIFLGLGWVFYGLTTRNGKLRHVPTFIGGERLDQTRISGVPDGAARHVEVTGVDFYRTVQRLPMLQWFYDLASRKHLDLYEACGRLVTRLNHGISAAHGGVLTIYLGWFVLGLLGILFVLIAGGR